MANSTPTRGGGGGGGGGGGARGGMGGGDEWDYAIGSNPPSLKYQNLEVGSSAIGLESPVRPNQAIRTQGLSINLFLTNTSVEDASIDVPSSYMYVRA